MTDRNEELLIQAGITTPARYDWTPELLKRQRAMRIDNGLNAGDPIVIEILGIENDKGERFKMATRRCSKEDLKRLMRRFVQKYRIPAKNISFVRTATYTIQTSPVAEAVANYDKPIDQVDAITP